MSLEKLGQRQTALLAKVTSMQDEYEKLGTDDGAVQRSKRLQKGIYNALDEVEEIEDQKREIKRAEVRTQLDAGNVVSGTAFDRDPLRNPKDRTPVFTGNDPWDGNDSPALRHTSPEEAKSRALSAVELASGMSEGSREKATDILEKQDPTSLIARYAFCGGWRPSVKPPWKGASRVSRGMGQRWYGVRPGQGTVSSQSQFEQSTVLHHRQWPRVTLPTRA